jgi:isoquinoline 1-oxidoreductase subunit beta
MNRRRFLLIGSGAASALLVGWGFLPARQRVLGSSPLEVAHGELELNGWVKIATDGTVVVLMAKQEMGQGIHSGAAMLLADELDADPASVRVEPVPPGAIYGVTVADIAGLPLHPDDRGIARRFSEWMLPKAMRELGLQLTGGSSSIRDLWEPMRAAGAMARATLVAAAAGEWSVGEAECSVAAGRVAHSSGRTASFGELVARHPKMRAAAEYRLKKPSEYQLIGRPQPRIDSHAKSTGGSGFACDVAPAGLLHAAVAMAPTFGSKLEHVGTSRAERSAGVRKVVRVPAGYGASEAVAVIARSYYEARRALDELDLEWGPSAATLADSAAIYEELERAAATGSGHAFRDVGRADSVLAASARTIEAQYRAPYLAHAAMEPLNCTAQTGDGKVTLWAGTQAPSFARHAIAKALGIGQKHVTLNALWMGGAFGRRLEVDFLVQAALVAQAADGAPVRTQWSREDDMRHDMYRPAGIARMQGGFDANGRLLAVRASLAGQELNHAYIGRVLGLPVPLPDKTAAEGVYDQPYEIPNFRVTNAAVELPVPVGNWRSVGHSHLAFYMESFVDELAAGAGADPLAFRLALLREHPRHAAVLRLAAERAGWGAPAPKAPDGAIAARGLALHESFGSIVAQVAEVSIGPSRRPRVHRVVCAIDCGRVINPNLVSQQLEGAVVYGLSAALSGEITLAGGRVVEGNFGDYPLLRIADCPAIEVHMIASEAPPQGVGEPGVPPIAPAVANALFALTGERLRSLPLRPSP